MGEQTYLLFGRTIVWCIGAAGVLTILVVALWALGWLWVYLIRSAMMSFGFWKAWLQMKQTHRAWVVWAAEVCRTNAADYQSLADEVGDLRKFFAEYDPDNMLRWKGAAS